MTVWPCPSQPVDCPNSQNSPLINNSSEAPDPPDFFGEAFGPTFVPPLGTTWGNPVGIGNCFSTVSQEAADLCAVGVVNGPTGPPGTWTGPTGQPVPPRHTFRSQAQTIDASCPDGSIYPYVVPAGMFSGPTQADANEAAIEWGMQQANAHLLCLSELPAIVCQGAAMNLNVFATSDFAAPPGANVWFTTGGLPDGVIFTGPPTGPATLTGTPHTPGSFGFTIGVTLPNGDNNLRFYEMTVAGVTNTPLPDAKIGQAYTASLEITGFNVPSFSLSGGSLPPGLAMDSVGNITGTATGNPLGYAFTVTVQDGFTGFRCDQTVEITTTAGCGSLPAINRTVVLTTPPSPFLATAFETAGSALVFLPAFAKGNAVQTWNLSNNALDLITPTDNADRGTAVYSPLTNRFWTGGGDAAGFMHLQEFVPSPLAYSGAGRDVIGDGSPVGIGFNIVNHLIYAVQVNKIFTVNPVSATVAGTWNLPGTVSSVNTTPTFDGGGKMYMGGQNAAGNALLLVFNNSSTPGLTNTFVLPDSGGGATPYSIAFAPTSGLVYLLTVDTGSGNYIALVVNPVTGGVVNTILLNAPFSPGTSAVFMTDNNLVGIALADQGVAFICALTNALLGYSGPLGGFGSQLTYVPAFNGVTFCDSSVNPNNADLLVS